MNLKYLKTNYTMGVRKYLIFILVVENIFLLAQKKNKLPESIFNDEN